MESETIGDILAQIKEKAASYTPEWRFGADAPDIGSALALVYGQMLSGTIKKMHYLPFKNQVAFFNALDAGLRPAAPSEGYAAFQTVDEETAGTEVAAGMRVLAPAEAEREEVSFETLEDIFVTPARIDCLLQVSGRRDFIGLQRLEAGRLRGQGIRLYAFGAETENLQEHKLYFCHDDVLSLTRAGRITVSFFLRGEPLPSEMIPEMDFFYSSGDGYAPFRSVTREGDRLVFIVGKNDPPFALRTEQGRESFWIQCVAKNAVRGKAPFCFHHVLLASSNEKTAPEGVYANGEEVTKEEFFPFGEQLSDYSEVCFLSDEIFRKRGAVITMAFQLSFTKVPVDTEEAAGISYEWIMKRSDFRTDREYDITVEEVVWEYYNGRGWTSLFETDGYRDIFSVKNGVAGQRYETMRFYCPADMQPILINAKEGCYIRARVTKVNNLYKQRGSYIVPVMDYVSLCYTYEEHPAAPQLLLMENNREWQAHAGAGAGFAKELYPFYGVAEEEDMLYFGFSAPPAGEPVKILFDFTKRLKRRRRNLAWQYWSETDGWRELELVDETENFSGTGIVTMLGNGRFAKKALYGMERYWVRVLDMAAQGERQARELPCLCGIYMNAVHIRQVSGIETEYFHMEVWQEHMSFPLREGNIIGIRLWVDETGSLGKEELALLMKERRIEPEYRADGELLRAWVEWEPVEDFLASGRDDRHFLLDAHTGSICFGNGRAGRIPPAARTDNIRVRYRTGGGSHTNVPAGAVTQTGVSVGFVNGVYNPKPLTGGQDAESLDHALRRNAALLRHQNMAVTERDFEEIAMDASGSIQRVKCFCGYDENGQKKSGAVTLVVLAEDFYSRKLEIERYMKDKLYAGLPAQGRFSVIAPRLVELRVRIEAVAEGFDDVFRLKKQVQARLDQFLNPLCGNFDGTGWKIGALPNAMQIRNAVTDIPGLLYVKNVFIRVFAGEASERREADLEKVKKLKYILPVSGKHETVIHIRERGEADAGGL